MKPALRGSTSSCFRSPSPGAGTLFHVRRPTIVPCIVLLLLALDATAVQAGAELVLKDGRTISGTEVRRQGTNYNLTLEDGQVLTFPIELVRELRLAEEGPLQPPPAPTAMRSEGPEVLAGPPDPVEPPAETTTGCTASVATPFFS